MEDIELIQQIKGFVRNKIKDVKHVNEICVSDTFTITTPNSQSDIKLHYQLSQLKAILQLLINLYNNFEVYKSFKVQPKTDYHNSLPCYSRCGDSDLLTCNGRPTESDICQALYNYVHCFISIEMKEAYPNLEDIEKMTVRKCIFCNGDLLNRMDKCDFCGTSVSEIHMEMLKASARRTSRVINPSKEEFNHGTPQSWLCERCECHNEYGSLTCKKCAASHTRDSWRCQRCTMENQYNLDKCDGCQWWKEETAVIEENIVKAAQKYLEKVEGERKPDLKPKEGDWADKWECVKCGALQPYSSIACEVCYHTLDDGSRWQCTKCSLINTCSSNQCLCCDFINCQQSRSCRRCRENKIRIDREICDQCLDRETATWWWCSYSNCGKVNKLGYDFCRHCRLHRYHSHVRGAPVKQWYYIFTREVWICYKCLAITDFSRNTCHQCSEER